MTTIKPIKATVLKQYKTIAESMVNRQLNQMLAAFDHKIVVLDDDPTGVQTVHNISVYTDWDEESIKKGFKEKNSMFFILTNSRAMTAEETAKIHTEIARRVVKIAQKTGRDFVWISRSDSTLRGHYPLETKILKEESEKHLPFHYDGEIIFPFFKEGARFTINDVHYVQEKDWLIPAALTEFARDKSFGYQASHLGQWCEEKTGGEYQSDTVTSIALENLRAQAIDEIEEQLYQVTDFNKVIVNAIDYVDVKVFCIALLKAMARGKKFIFRSAAALTKVLGGVPDRGLLTKAELVSRDNNNGGIILVGSHVNKTTQQLKELENCRFPIQFIEFNQHLVVSARGLQPEVKRVVQLAEKAIQNGKTVAVFTKRSRFDLPGEDKEEQLKVSLKISAAVTSIIGRLAIRPNFIIAKGGITSSDVGTKALQVKKALVMGQIKPGIPVWMTGEESKFPHLPYIIFPGNVGTVNTLREAVEILLS